MTINFNLFTPDNKVSAIRLVIYHKGKTYRKSTGISCKTADWSAKKQKCSNIEIDGRLKDIRIKIEEKLDELSQPEYIQKVIDWAIAGGYEPSQASSGGISFWDYFYEWAKRDMNDRSPKVFAYKIIKRLMGDKENWNDIDSAYFFRLKQAMEDEGKTLNTIHQVIFNLKGVMKEGVKLKYHTNMDYLGVKASKETPDTTYLTEDELQLLWKYSESEKITKGERKILDMFLLGVYTAARVSDVRNMSTANFHGNTFRYTQIKTGNSVIMPLSSKIRLLIERNGGSMPMGTSYNQLIKKICRKAGIDAPFESTRTEGNKKVKRVGPKWKFIGSHTARRTGATILYKAGIPTKQCMFITGHKSESEFMKYIRITKEENAAALAKLEFFS